MVTVGTSIILGIYRFCSGVLFRGMSNIQSANRFNEKKNCIEWKNAAKFCLGLNWILQPSFFQFQTYVTLLSIEVDLDKFVLGTYHTHSSIFLWEPKGQKNINMQYKFAKLHIHLSAEQVMLSANK